MLTIPDICDKLKRLDEVTILELLEINSEEIVNRFQDKIEDIADYLEEVLDDN
jgi:Asp-tRNA(Asn)/Glu-tRNA(Gln) amidotransferase C subunit